MGKSYIFLVLALVCVFQNVCAQNDQSSQREVFDTLYRVSEPYGLRSTRYLLSYHSMFYSEAEIACRELGGYLAEINSPSEMTFITDFIRPHTNEWGFIHINGYRDSNSGNFDSSLGVDIVAVINEETSTSNNYNISLPADPHPGNIYVDWWTRWPVATNNPPTCIELDKRGETFAMVNARCDRSLDRYLCERPL